MRQRGLRVRPLCLKYDIDVTDNFAKQVLASLIIQAIAKQLFLNVTKAKKVNITSFEEQLRYLLRVFLS